MYQELKLVTVHNLFDDILRNWDEEILKDLCNKRDIELIKQIFIPIRSQTDS